MAIKMMKIIGLKNLERVNLETSLIAMKEKSLLLKMAPDTKANGKTV